MYLGGRPRKASAGVAKKMVFAVEHEDEWGARWMVMLLFRAVCSLCDLHGQQYAVMVLVGGCAVEEDLNVPMDSHS